MTAKEEIKQIITHLALHDANGEEVDRALSLLEDMDPRCFVQQRDLNGMKCNRCGRFVDADVPYLELVGVEPCRWCLGCFDEVYKQIQQIAKGLRILAGVVPGLKKWEKM